MKLTGQFYIQIILYEILILGILVGIIIGGIIGGLTGMAKYEGVTHLYTRGISLGERLFVLKTDPDNLETAKKVLQKNGCIGVQSFTETKPASPAADTYDAAEKD